MITKKIRSDLDRALIAVGLKDAILVSQSHRSPSDVKYLLQELEDFDTEISQNGYIKPHFTEDFTLRFESNRGFSTTA